MAFNPLNIFNDKNKQATPPRGPRGRFVSSKPKDIKPSDSVDPEKTEKSKMPISSNNKKSNAKDNETIGPITVTFYGHDINKYYQNGVWYFNVDDIAHVADINPENPNMREGDPEKLDEAKKKFVVKIDGVETAKAHDIVKFIPYFRGVMPGPITGWLIDSGNTPAPSPEDVNSTPNTTQ